jgi:hypothetical protein
MSETISPHHAKGGITLVVIAVDPLEVKDSRVEAIDVFMRVQRTVGMIAIQAPN